MAPLFRFRDDARRDAARDGGGCPRAQRRRRSPPRPSRGEFRDDAPRARVRGGARAPRADRRRQARRATPSGHREGHAADAPRERRRDAPRIQRRRRAPRLAAPRRGVHGESRGGDVRDARAPQQKRAGASFVHAPPGEPHSATPGRRSARRERFPREERVARPTRDAVFVGARDDGLGATRLFCVSRGVSRGVPPRARRASRDDDASSREVRREKSTHAPRLRLGVAVPAAHDAPRHRDLARFAPGARHAHARRREARRLVYENAPRVEPRPGRAARVPRDGDDACGAERARGGDGDAPPRERARGSPAAFPETRQAHECGDGSPVAERVRPRGERGER